MTTVSKKQWRVCSESDAAVLAVLELRGIARESRIEQSGGDAE
jgi:hypothetical protein